ncbi:60S ribosomal protein L27 [Pelomyxa schiedti]|nr:60S ribosomal protein L27 [Pelomyxa schiedti]
MGRTKSSHSEKYLFYPSSPLHKKKPLIFTTAPFPYDGLTCYLFSPFLFFHHAPSGPTKSRRFDHCLVAGIAQYPRPIKRRMPLHQIKRRSIVRGFASYFNLRHVMPTRYNLDLNLKGIVDPKKMEPGSKNHKVMKHKLRVAFTQRYITGKNKWFFTKLRF